MNEGMLPVFAKRRALFMLVCMAALLSVTAILTAGERPDRGQAAAASDPVAHDPYLVKDIITTTNGIGLYDQESLVSVNGLLFLSIDDGDHGFELWKSDGSIIWHLAGEGYRPGWLIQADTSDRN